MANVLHVPVISSLFLAILPAVFAVDVLILGAGASGIAAGKHLHDNGVTDFLILEGSNRIGGRLKEVQFGGKTVEVGANWIQPGDTSVNPLASLSESLEIAGNVSAWDSFIFRGQNGENLTDEALSEYPAFESALDYIYELAEDLIDNDKPDMSVRSALHWNPTTPVQKSIEYYDFDFEIAAIPYVTSLKATATIDGANEIFVTDQRGFSYVLRSQAETFLEANDTRLLLEKIVTKVEYDDNGVTVTCSDGSNYTAPYAIITFSIGVLQSDLVEFYPPLPDWKVEEIFQFDMALYTKIFLKFPDGIEKFWDDEEFILYASSRRGYYTIWQNLEAEGLFEAGTNLLMMTVTGDESRRVEYETDDQIKSEVMAILRQVYGNGIPDVEEIMLYRWSQDPLFRGAFTNWPVEVSRESHRRLEGNVGRLHFGGEATDPHWNGYIQAGLFSGEREARKIMKCMEGACEAFSAQIFKRGCTYQVADNYDASATVDDGSCRFTPVTGSSQSLHNYVFNQCFLCMYVCCTFLLAFLLAL
uniref:Amine oxidase n=1 Tax=Saccoglossus kowalevskii TaxID=10224 RepID=A0ABM0ME57_SACKO|nr:PREDICTED: polyamine oxidase-like [Saccoglossus kowalevskii]